MFIPKTMLIQKLAREYPLRIEELENIFVNKTNVYIDYANVRPWSTRLGWHIEIKRLKQFLESFDTVYAIKMYSGTLFGDLDSEMFSKEAKQLFGDNFKTKPVKVLRLSIDVSSISPTSPDILKNFIRKPLLQKLSVGAVEYLNEQLRDLNRRGVRFLEDLKCNFDVEIGRDMLIGYERNEINNFILWSGDSDFADPIHQLLQDGKKVVLFATARRVASELHQLQKEGLFIFDIQKIRDFICWKKEMKK